MTPAITARADRTIKRWLWARHEGTRILAILPLPGAEGLTVADVAGSTGIETARVAYYLQLSIDRGWAQANITTRARPMRGSWAMRVFTLTDRGLEILASRGWA